MKHLTPIAVRTLALVVALGTLSGAVSATNKRMHSNGSLYTVAINGPTLVRSGVQCEWTSTTDIPSPFYEWSVITETGATVVGTDPYLDYTFVAPPAHPILQLRVYNGSGVDQSDSRVMGVSQTGPLC